MTLDEGAAVEGVGLFSSSSHGVGVGPVDPSRLEAFTAGASVGHGRCRRRRVGWSRMGMDGELATECI